MICDDEGLTFYLGTHRDRWLVTAPEDVALFISHRVLAGRKTLPRAPMGRNYAVDSGAFTELSLHGEFRTCPEEYIRALARYGSEIGHVAWAAPQDWMCEPFMLAKTGLAVAEHQRRTVANFLSLEEFWPRRLDLVTRPTQESPSSQFDLGGMTWHSRSTTVGFAER